MTERAYRDVLARGVRLRVAEGGTGAPVLFLHGLCMDHSTWSRLLPTLGEGFHWVTPDLPGFGESEKPPAARFAYDVDAFADAVVDLYAGLGLGRAAVVGHALGAAIAITLAARHPELVSKLVLVDAACGAPPEHWPLRLAAAPIVGGIITKQLLGPTTFRAFFQSALFASGSGVGAERTRHYYELFNTPAARGSALATLRRTGDTRSITALTPRIETPTLVIWGRDDPLFPAGQGQRLAREIRGARFELLDAGHSPQEERPEAVGRVIREFLSEERLSTRAERG